MAYVDFVNQLPVAWQELLVKEFQSEYMTNIYNKVVNEYKTKEILPKPQLIFSAFRHFDPSQTKVVIIGQDPYHTPGVANGLAFSTSVGKLPQSLINIYKEICDEYKVDFQDKKNSLTGDLSARADQGVLLLNNCLTVEAHQPLSHKNIGWDKFTDAVIIDISQKYENIVFLLWGSLAQSKSIYIDNKKHLVLKAAHPSPLSANRGFFGCKHFVTANDYLMNHNKGSISRI